jgi:hypothetical protein
MYIFSQYHSPVRGPESGIFNGNPASSQEKNPPTISFYGIGIMACNAFGAT